MLSISMVFLALIHYCGSKYFDNYEFICREYFQFGRVECLESPVYGIENGTITSYGARPNDGIDDTVYIQRAAQSGKEIFFQSGVYLLSGSIKFSSNSKFRSIGPNHAVFKVLDGSKISEALFLGDGISDVALAGLTIQAGLGNSYSAVYFNRSKPGHTIQLKDLFIDGAGASGLAVSNTEDVVVSGCRIRATVIADGIRISHSKNVTCIYNDIYEMQRQIPNRRGIQIGSTTGAIVYRNRVSDVPVGNYAFDFGGSSDVIMRQNEIKACGGGVDLEGGNVSIEIMNNLFVGRADVIGSSIGIYGVDGRFSGVRIFNNIVKGYFHGIRIEGGHSIYLIDNVISSSAGSAVTFVSRHGETPRSVRVIGNIIDDSSVLLPGRYPAISIDVRDGCIESNIILGGKYSYAIVNNSGYLINLSGNLSDKGMSGLYFP